MAELINRVTQSNLQTIDLEQFYPSAPIAEFDLKDFLFQGMVLREKEFREALTAHDWTQYSGKTLLVFCSADAIIPAWAHMLVASKALPFATEIFPGDLPAYLEAAYRKAINQMHIQDYQDQRVVIKGCGSSTVPPGAYLELVKRLQPVVRSLMFGEPCSTVPIFKR